MLLLLARRNLWRHSRRTMLTVTAIGFALTFLIGMVSFMQESKEMLVEQIAKTGIGHIQVYRRGYRQSRKPSLLVAGVSDIVQTVSRVPGVEAAGARPVFTASVRSSNSSSVLVVGCTELPQTSRSACRNWQPRWFAEASSHRRQSRSSRMHLSDTDSAQEYSLAQG